MNLADLWYRLHAVRYPFGFIFLIFVTPALADEPYGTWEPVSKVAEYTTGNIRLSTTMIGFETGGSFGLKEEDNLLTPMYGNYVSPHMFEVISQHSKSGLMPVNSLCGSGGIKWIETSIVGPGAMFSGELKLDLFGNGLVPVVGNNFFSTDNLCATMFYVSPLLR